MMHKTPWLALSLAAITTSAAAAQCFDRAEQSHRFVVDSHLHFQPFSGPSLPHQELIGYLERAGIQYANVYGIGQTRIQDWGCFHGGPCDSDTIMPTMKNDFINAKNMADHPSRNVGLTLSMTFPDLQHPETIVDRMDILDAEFPGFFQWMGEANLVKQALFVWGHEPATLDDIDAWAPFMARLRERDMPLALHSDFGNDQDPLKYLHLMQAVLERYPDNTIVWMHLGMSREQRDMEPRQHTRILSEMMDEYPNLWVDISWSVLYDYYFSEPTRRPFYVDFLNQYSQRVLTGTDIVASENTGYSQYERALDANSYINQFLDDDAFRNIALGQNYFDLMKLDEVAPAICTQEG